MGWELAFPMKVLAPVLQNLQGSRRIKGCRVCIELRDVGVLSVV